ARNASGTPLGPEPVPHSSDPGCVRTRTFDIEVVEVFFEGVHRAAAGPELNVNFGSARRQKWTAVASLDGHVRTLSLRQPRLSQPGDNSDSERILRAVLDQLDGQSGIQLADPADHCVRFVDTIKRGVGAGEANIVVDQVVEGAE